MLIPAMIFLVCVLTILVILLGSSLRKKNQVLVKKNQEIKDLKASLPNSPESIERSLSKLKAQILSICKQIGLDLHQMGCESKTGTDFLAIACVLVTNMAINRNGQDSLMCKSPVSRLDTIFFTTFLARLLCLSDVNSPAAAKKLSDELLSKVRLGASQLYSIGPGSVDSMSENRILFYDSICRSAKGMEDRISRITDEFLYILNFDEANGYAPYSSKTPLVLVDFQENFSRAVEVKNFREYLVDTYLVSFIYLVEMDLEKQGAMK